MKIEIGVKYIKDVLEADDEHKRIQALFDLKNEYNRILLEGIKILTQEKKDENRRT